METKQLLWCIFKELPGLSRKTPAASWLRFTGLLGLGTFQVLLKALAEFAGETFILSTRDRGCILCYLNNTASISLTS